MLCWLGFVFCDLGLQVPNAESLLGIYGNEWSRTLPAREQDVLYLHLWMCFGGMHARTQPFSMNFGPLTDFDIGFGSTISISVSLFVICHHSLGLLSAGLPVWKFAGTAKVNGMCTEHQLRQIIIL